MSESANVSTWQWTAQRAHAAELVAADLLSDTEIANKLGITQRTLERWKLVPEFRARVQERLADLTAAVAALGIADRRNRIAAQDERWRKLRAVIEARAVAYANAPGGETGLIVMQQKALGVGRYMQVVDEYALDAALLAELRKLEEHTAKELGQWTEKHDHTGSIVIREYGGFDPREV